MTRKDLIIKNNPKAIYVKGHKDEFPNKLEHIKKITKLLPDTQCVITTFPSITSLLLYLDNNNIITNVYNPEASHQIGDTEWHGTGSYQEAVDLVRYGWKAGAQAIKNKMDVLIPRFNKNAVRTKLDVSGANACVPAYLNNNPRTMFKKKKVLKKAKTLTVNKVIDINGHIQQEDYIASAACAMALVYALEQQGYAVNLNIVCGTHYRNTTELVRVNIKKANERINLPKIAFAIGNVGMQRRIMFRYDEIKDTSHYMSLENNFYGRAVKKVIYEAMLLKNDEQEIFIPALIDENEMHKLLDRQLEIYKTGDLFGK